MEPPHEEQYSQERNHGAYMSMRDYRHFPWQNQKPVERNPSSSRSMRDYRNPPWMSAPSYMVPPRNAPYENAYNPSWGNHTNSSPPQYAPPPHPQSTSPMEEAILNLTKLVGDFVGEQKMINAHLNQRIDNVESSLSQKLDELQNDMFQKLNNLEDSISRLTIQHGHQEEENLEGEWLTDQEELMQEPVEAPEELLTGEAGGGSGKEIVEEPQELVLKPFPTELNPTANAQATYSPLPVAPSTDQVYILPTPGAYPTPETPSPKVTPICAALATKF